MQTHVLDKVSDHTTAGLRMWNSLPSKLWQCNSLAEFKWLQKTYLFGDHGVRDILVSAVLEVILPALTYWLTSVQRNTGSGI